MLKAAGVRVGSAGVSSLPSLTASSFNDQGYRYGYGLGGPYPCGQGSEGRYNHDRDRDGEVLREESTHGSTPFFRNPTPCRHGLGREDDYKGTDRDRLTPRSQATVAPSLSRLQHSSVVVENSPVRSPRDELFCMVDTSFSPGVENTVGGGLSPGGFGGLSSGGTGYTGEATFRLGVENSPGGNRSLYTAGTVEPSTFRPGVENSMGGGEIEKSPGDNRSLYTTGTVGAPTFRPGVENSFGGGASTHCSSPKHGQRSSSPLTPSPQRSRHCPRDLLGNKDNQGWQQRQQRAEEAGSGDRGPGDPRRISSNSSRLLLLVQDGVLNQEEYECALLDIETQFVTEFPGARPLWISGLSVRGHEFKSTFLPSTQKSAYGYVE